MNTNYSTSFEYLLKLAQDLPLPKNENERKVSWCEPSHTIGLSKQQNGKIELFLCGDELRALSPLVRRHLRFDQWSRVGGEIFRANRIVFPAEEHYTAATAFLAEELVRKEAVTSMQSGFLQTEPLLEMMLRRTALSDEEILGLIGELRFLEVLLSLNIDSTEKVIILDTWRGHEQSTRDFVFGRASVEVKTTRSDRSVHHINSIGQVDPRRSESDEAVEQLYLLSFGFNPPANTNLRAAGLSLPGQVDTILALLGESTDIENRNEIQQLFLIKVAAYGSVQGNGYIHDEMKGWSVYVASWNHTFTRIYDMNDPAIQVLRRKDINKRTHVMVDSIQFNINLPEKISGDINPQRDLFILANQLLN